MNTLETITWMLFLFISGWCIGAYIANFLWGHHRKSRVVEKIVPKPMEACQMPMSLRCCYCRKYVRYRERKYLPSLFGTKPGKFCHQQCHVNQEMLKQISKMGPTP